MQNISTRHPTWGKRIRACFIPPPGYSMLVGDLSQIELGILAYYLEIVVGDSSMAQAARDGKDFHQANADAWGKKRKDCKNGIFAVNYGASARRVSLTLDISVEEAMDIIETVEENIEIKQLKDRFWSSLDLVRDIHPIPHEYARYRQGVFYDCMGVRHFYPYILSKEKYRVSSTKRQSFNCLLQGGCYSILAHLLNQLMPHVESRDAWIAGLVHDEAIIYVREDQNAELLQVANEIFNSFSLGSGDQTVPVKAEFHKIANWSEK